MAFRRGVPDLPGKRTPPTKGLLLKEELRLKDARMRCIPAQRRPHYLSTERLAILEPRAARGWSQAQTADRLLVTKAARSAR
jgi:hypothetical protein